MKSKTWTDRLNQLGYDICPKCLGIRTGDICPKCFGNGYIPKQKRPVTLEEIRLKFPTAQFAPMPDCKACQGTGERINVEEFYRTGCVCIYFGERLLNQFTDAYLHRFFALKQPPDGTDGY